MSYLIKPEPLAGTKIRILQEGYSKVQGKEAIRLSKLPYLTIKDSLLIPETDENGDNKVFHWMIYTNESEDFFMVIEDKDWERLEPVKRNIPYNDPFEFIRQEH
jgi:hypothetical protein